MQRRRSSLVVLLPLALSACVRPSAPALHASASESPTPSIAEIRRDGWSPPVGWRAHSAFDFEQLLAAELPAGQVTAPSAATLDELSTALAADATTATRAALLLARTSHPASHERLLARLEQRVVGPDRASDVGDCTAAAAVARGPLADEAGPRLALLAAGPDPHPDLEVRTECAAAALALGHFEVVDFLLAVLRIDTDEARARGERLTDSPTTAWARGRAAQALCRAAEVEHDVWTDAPLPVRERRALELEVLLAQRSRSEPR